MTQAPASAADRRAAAFTILELLIAMAITLVLLGIVSDVLNNVHKTISIGAANSEVITYAASLEQRMRDDFRRLNTQGFLTVRFELDYGNPTTIATATPTVNSTTGAISQITLNANGLGYLQPPPVTFIDPAGTGSGAVATAILANDNTGRVSALNLISGGSNYSVNTQVVLANPVDQICFFANGPWVTSRYNVQTATASSGGTTDSGLARTFQSDIARIWYGHLWTNELQAACLSADTATNSFTIPGNYTGTFAAGKSFVVLGSGSNNGNYTVASSGYTAPSNTTQVFATTPVSTLTSRPSGYLEVVPTTFFRNADETNNALQPQYWRLGRHALLISDESAVRYDGIGVDASGSPAGAGGASLLPQISPIPGPITGFTVNNGGTGYAGTPALLTAPPISATATLSGNSVNGVNLGWTPGNNLRPLYASQTIWQATDYINPLTGYYYYGIENGLSDIAAPIDLPTIRELILTPNTAPALIPNNSTDLNFSTATPGQRMFDACFRVYGTPYINPSAPSAELTMPSQSVLTANCSAFRIDVSYDGVTFLRPIGSGASLTANLAGGTVTPPVIVNSGGFNYNPNSMVLVVDTTGTSGALLVPVVNSAGTITSVNVISGGSGLTPNPPAGTTAPIKIVTDYCASGYGLDGSYGCMPWPKLIRITATLQDQKSTLHNLAALKPQNPQAIDGRPFTYVLEVPQP